MIISNQIEHLRNLYEKQKYLEVIQFGTITLPIALEEKRYDDALICYEYLASAYYESGNYEKFLIAMVEYEKLCLTYGQDRNKMLYHYLYSKLQVITKNFDAAIDATKASIKYAHYLKNNELIVINYYNLAAQLARIDEWEKARIAMSIGEYYKNKVTNYNLIIVEGYVGALYYFATIANKEEFERIKQIFLEHLKEGQNFYDAKILLSEAILTFNLGEIEKSILLFENAYIRFKEQQNIMHVIIIEYFLNEFNLTDRFRYRNEQQQLIKDFDCKLLDPNKVKSLLSDLFFKDDVSALALQYPNVISKELIVQHVEQAIQNNESLYCLHWCFNTNEAEELLDNLFVEQLMFTLFETIYHFIFKHNAEVNVISKNEGEAFIKDISETEFFDLLLNLKEILQSTVVHSTKGMVEIPLHFGFIHSEQLPKEHISYEQLAAYADANLYYAKTHGQLYIYN